MLNKIKNEVMKEYRSNKVGSVFMVTVIVFAFLTYIKPGSTDNLLNYLGMTAVNFFGVAVVGIIVWIVFFRKKGGFSLSSLI